MNSMELSITAWFFIGSPWWVWFEGSCCSSHYVHPYEQCGQGVRPTSARKEQVRFRPRTFERAARRTNDGVSQGAKHCLADNAVSPRGATRSMPARKQRCERLVVYIAIPMFDHGPVVPAAPPGFLFLTEDS
jgi:hypothetical protein